MSGSVACALAMLALGTGCATGQTAQPASTPTDQTSVTAIDILLESDATMIQHAEAVNARLRSVFPNCAHSADVTIGLLINGHWLPVAQLGPDLLLLDVVADHSLCDAVIKLRVDKAGSSPSSKGNVQAHDFSKMVLTSQDQR